MRLASQIPIRYFAAMSARKTCIRALLWILAFLVLFPSPLFQTTVHAGDELLETSRVYEQKIKPIFMNKCFDCHSNQTRYPNYYRLPIVKQFIDHDIKEGRGEIDFSDGFPFKTKNSLPESLRAIREEIEEGDMPPFTYRILHSGSAVTDAEKKQIYDWLDMAQKAVQQVP